MQEVRSKVGGWPLATAIAVLLVFLFFIREILLPFILAAAIAFILTPVVDAIERRLRIKRWIGAVIIYLVFLGVFGLLAYWVGTVMIREVVEIVRQFPQMLHKLIGEAAQIISAMTGQAVNVDALTKEILAELALVFGGGTGLKIAGYGVAIIFGAVLMIVLLIYFLVSGKRVAAGVFWLVPPEYRSGVNSIAAKVLPMLWRYFVGLIAVVSYTIAVASIGFVLVFHVAHAALLAVAVGLLELIPVIGPAISMILILLNAVQENTILTVVGLAAFAIALRLSIDEVIGPLVLGRAAQVHPVVIIFTFLSGAALFGIIGLLLAVPVAASIKIVLSTYYAEPIKGQSRRPEGRLRSS